MRGAAIHFGLFGRVYPWPWSKRWARHGRGHRDNRGPKAGWAKCGWFRRDHGSGRCFDNCRWPGDWRADGFGGNSCNGWKLAVNRRGSVDRRADGFGGDSCNGRKLAANRRGSVDRWAIDRRAAGCGRDSCSGRQLARQGRRNVDRWAIDRRATGCGRDSRSGWQLASPGWYDVDRWAIDRRAAGSGRDSCSGRQLASNGREQANWWPVKRRAGRTGRDVGQWWNFVAHWRYVHGRQRRCWNWRSRRQRWKQLAGQRRSRPEPLFPARHKRSADHQQRWTELN